MWLLLLEDYIPLLFAPTTFYIADVTDSNLSLISIQYADFESVDVLVSNDTLSVQNFQSVYLFLFCCYIPLPFASMNFVFCFLTNWNQFLM